MRLGPGDYESTLREVVALRTLAGCRNVVQWMPDVVFDAKEKMVRLHMEYYPDGDLDSLMASYGKNPVPKDTVTQVFCCLAMALLDCHKRGICHRDIKPANVLVSRKMWNGQPVTVAYLADFGLVDISKAPLTTGVVLCDTKGPGTPIYMAPESIYDDPPVFSERSDLFSLGCTIYELCNLNVAYTDYSRDYVPAMGWTAVKEYGGRLCPLVSKLMRLLPAHRPTTLQLVASLEAYCISRWEKQKAAMLWETLAVVSQVNPLPQPTGIVPPPWEQQQQQQRQPFQLPLELRALQQPQNFHQAQPPPYQAQPPPYQQQQPQQQQQSRAPMLPPGLQQAMRARQIHQQRVAATQQIQMQSALEQQKQQQQKQQQQFGGNRTP
ncbi:kinase-like domain-containing protein [Lasiosphaeris hirsuta]|uniref:non-specific serine/threonine protein kinase n=1 Tax=Lasiosphaeris hirsuta TaxID=260670 RepID=A0AA40B8L7_9PEZI|nr:kinase-like domain-containing protein [Lasiosphaeris hirsuta]